MPRPCMLSLINSFFLLKRFEHWTLSSYVLFFTLMLGNSKPKQTGLLHTVVTGTEMISTFVTLEES